MKEARKTAIRKHEFSPASLVRTLSKAKANGKPYTEASTENTKTYPSPKRCRLTKQKIAQDNLYEA
jgi:hypothetical protein